MIDSFTSKSQMLKVAAVVGKTKLEMICYAFVERVFTGFEEETLETKKLNLMDHKLSSVMIKS